MSEASAQQQPAAPDVQQMQQAQQQQQQQNQQNQTQQMQQPQQIQVMIQQPQSQVDMQQQQSQSQQQQQQQSQQVNVANGQQTITMQMSSDGSNGNTVQLPHSSAPMATIETSGQMQISNIQPQPQQPGQVQMANIQTQQQTQVQQQHTMQAQTPTQQQQQQQQTQIQQINDWSHGRVQLIQQAGPQFVQYNAQGQLIMPGTMLQHPTSGAIQVIAAPNKQFQSQQMLTTAHAHKQVISQGQATSFPAGYAAIPTTTNQTLVIGQLGVISSQPNMKQNEMQQTYTSCATGRTVQQNAQTMQFSPWQFNASLPQGLTWATPQPQALLTTQNHPIFIRGGPQQDGQQQQVQTPMFIQSPPPQHLQQHHGQTMVQASGGVMQNIGQMVSGTTTTTIKSQRGADIQPKVVGTPTGLGSNRQLSILPSGHNIRPNATISTQTTTGIQHLNQMQKAQLKVRPKTGVRQSFSIAPHKSDAANQTNQSKPIQSPQQTINANKMILTSSGQLVPQIQQQQQQAVQVQHLQQQQQAQQQIKLVSMQSPNHQIVSMQSPQVTYQQQQIIKPNTNVMSMSMNSPQKIHIHQLQQGQAIVSSQPQQQITILDRPVIPVVSCAPQASASAQLPISPQIQTTVSMPPPTKLDESPKTLSPVVQSQDNVIISTSETPETNTTVSFPITSNEDNSRDKGLPKALVKPQVLTHVIEGFVIQEADTPFPVNRSCTLTDSSNTTQDKAVVKLDDEPPNKKTKTDINSSEKSKCDFCGKYQELQKFKFKKKSKRFCTQECLKLFENTLKTNGEMDKKNGKNWECESNGSAGDSSNTSSSAELTNQIQNDGKIKIDLIPELTPVNPLTWTVKDVRKFIGQLTDSEEIAADFESHEIDGQALMLLKEDHLIRDMSMKLGPALKIFAKLDSIRSENPELQPPTTSQ